MLGEIVLPYLAELGRRWEDGIEGSEKRLRTLAKSTTLTLAGPGADAEFARGVGATWLDGGPVEAAAQLG